MELTAPVKRLVLPSVLGAVLVGLVACGPAEEQARSASGSGEASASSSTADSGSTAGSASRPSGDSLHARAQDDFSRILGEGSRVLPPDDFEEENERFSDAQPMHTVPASCAPMTNMASSVMAPKAQDAIIGQHSDQGGAAVLSAVRYADADVAAEVLEEATSVMSLCARFRFQDHSGASGTWEYEVSTVRVDGREGLAIRGHAVSQDGLLPVDTTTLYVREDDVIGEVSLYGRRAQRSVQDDHAERDRMATQVMEAVAS